MGHPLRDYGLRETNHPPEDLPAGLRRRDDADSDRRHSVPTPGTKFGVTQYVSFMSVTNWGSPGQWTTDYSAIAYSEDNGENWEIAPTSVRYNQPMSGNQNFQQAAFVRPGRRVRLRVWHSERTAGAAYLSRVQRRTSSTCPSTSTTARVPQERMFGRRHPRRLERATRAATPVFGEDKGCLRRRQSGNQVSEMSVQYNKQLGKYVVLYGDQFNNIVIRTSDTPQGTWSGEGTDTATRRHLRANDASMVAIDDGHRKRSVLELSWWSDYNVTLMKTDLTKV